MVHVKTKNEKPVFEQRVEAAITKNQNRLKVYNSNKPFEADKIFLNDGDHFEIELFNYFDEEVLAEISLNGKTISQGGIILRPGERVYLERYLDTNNKFKFETYNVDANDAKTQEAIKNNGSIDIKFYHKKKFTDNQLPQWFMPYRWDCNGLYNINDSELQFYTNNSTHCGSNVNTINSNLHEPNEPIGKKSMDKSLQSEETGRIGKGEKSNQNFTETNGNFLAYSFGEYYFQILPVSKKGVYSSEIRHYCPECGTRIKKKSWKFCPTCGIKQD
jgi:hypothetical protein